MDLQPQENNPHHSNYRVQYRAALIDSSPNTTGEQDLHMALIADATISALRGDPDDLLWLFDPSYIGPVSLDDCCTRLNIDTQKFRSKLKSQLHDLKTMRYCCPIKYIQS